jgi:phosphoglycolate phosphatase-like HAD superfamily hydrolase
MTRAAQFRDLKKSDRLRLYMKNNGLNPAHTFVVGDTVEEIEIAREFGMGSAAITGGLASEEMLRASNPDYIIHSLDELAPILRQRRFVE